MPAVAKKVYFACTEVDGEPRSGTSVPPPALGYASGPATAGQETGPAGVQMSARDGGAINGELKGVDVQLFRAIRIARLTGLSRATINRLVRPGDSPQAVRITQRVVAWKKRDIAYINLYLHLCEGLPLRYAD